MTTATAQQTTLTVLSVRQPHAGAFFDDRPERAKTIENRTWQTHYRGRLWIHASSTDRRPSVADLDNQLPDVAASIARLYDDPFSRTTGAIIGSVNLVDIVPSEELELLAMIPPNAKKLPKDVAAFLRPSQREPFIAKWRHILPHVQRLSEIQIETYLYGPFCWIVDSPQLLAEPIPTGGRLNLWKFQADEDQLTYL